MNARPTTRPHALTRRVALAGALTASLGSLVAVGVVGAAEARPASSSAHVATPVPGHPSTLPSGRYSEPMIRPGASFGVPGTGILVSLDRTHGRYVLTERTPTGTATVVFSAGEDDVRAIKQTLPQGRAGRAILIAREGGDYTEWVAYVRRGGRLVEAPPLYGTPPGSGFDVRSRPYRSWFGSEGEGLFTRRYSGHGAADGTADRYRVVQWRLTAADRPHLVPTVLGGWCFDSTSGANRAVACR